MDINLNSALNLIKYPKKIINSHGGEDLLNLKVEVSDHIGTIRYIGKLKHKKDSDEEIWLGIEWDDCSRGKHSGTVEGFEYFQTKHQTGGSLIKLNKVNFGHSFNEAIEHKYNFCQAEDVYQFLNRAVESDLFIQANKKRIPIELVGKEKAFKKFSQLDSIANIDLAFSYISSIELNISNNFTKLRELILQKTLFNKWSHLLKLFVNFPNLEFLNFSDNIIDCKLQDPEFEELQEKLMKTDLKLNYLILNKCNLDFYSLNKISFLLKNVQTLYLMGNNLNEETLSQKKITFGDSMQNVNFISLEKNKIKNFIKVIDCLNLEKIAKINLNQNHLISLFEDADLNLIEKFKTKITSLFIDFNQFIEEEKLLKQISQFEGLVDLDILNNNIIQAKIETIKYQLIGRLMKLETLNNTSITKDVRKDSEIVYLKNSVLDYTKIYPFVSKDKFSTEQFESFMKENHPNYFIYKKKYFDPMEDIFENVKVVEQNTLKGNILEVTFQYEDKKIVKKFPKTTSFSNLKNVLSKLFKLNSNFQFNINNSEIVTDESKNLDNYNINSSSIIHLILI